MVEMKVDSITGFGKCTTETGLEISVVRAESLYNLHIKREGSFGYFVVENKKRLSTIQKYMDANKYDVKIVEV